MKDPDAIKLSYDNFIFKFGRATLGAAKAVIWAGSVAAFNTLDETADTLFSVVSSSADDEVGQGGATHIEFIYQTLLGVEYTSPEIALTGLVGVDIPTITGAISYRMKVTQTEDDDILTGPNHGIIKLYKTGTVLDIFAEIPATEGQTLMAIYRIPANKYGELLSLFLDAAEGKAATVWAKVRKDRSSAWQTKGTFQVFQDGTNRERKRPGFIYPGSDIVLIGIAGAAGTIVDAQFELELKDLAEFGD